MKLYHPQTYEKLGFDLILSETASFISNEEAKERCIAIAPDTNVEYLTAELKRVAEFLEMLNFDDPFPGGHFISLKKIIERLDIEGDWLNTRLLDQFHKWLKGIRDIRKYFKNRTERYPLLVELVSSLPFSQQLINDIDKILDQYGNISDNASPELQSIRKKLGKSSNQLRSALQKVLRKAIEQNWSQDKEITIRNDRLVIPVKAESRRHVPGFVHDMSQSGNTVYIEPTEALSLNNEMRELQIREHNEIVRILQAITNKVRIHLPEIEAFREIMIQVELIRAKAKLAQKLKATLPTIIPDGERLVYREAYYPLLLLKSLREKFQVVPLNLSMDRKKRIVVISGPNAGGKSVTLKTVGLLQLMLQSGFLLPVDEGSEFRFFDSLFLDIGDEQSIDSDLSTYTSRLTAWRQMGDNMSKNSLFCVDEFGSGTDPKMGGAIAESFLERFVRQMAYGIITTHYGNLKDFAEVNSGTINAAMQFDNKELKPTYMLMEGVPGRSYAFEMAKRVGVHNTIVRRARKKMGTDEIDVERVLKELEKKNSELKSSLSESKKKEHRLQQLVEKNERVEKELSSNKKQIINEAKREAQQLIKDANRKIENTIREIREIQAEKERTKELRQELRAEMPELSEAENLNLPPITNKKKKKNGKRPASQGNGIKVLTDRNFKEGNWVKLKASQSYGQLISIQGKKGVVETDGLRINVKLDQLDKIETPKQKKSTNSLTYTVENVPAKSAKLELDIMGKRVEEALNEVDKFLDEGRLAGLRRLRVLHGKGTGALREAVRNHLRGFPFIDRLSDASVEEGGAGWTIIELNE
ncbi:MAG: endonuclease MutS2 [Bacteroidia bacterium]|nr:endonuclease MutS2 [Bacteroidia bacterium]